MWVPSSPDSGVSLDMDSREASPRGASSTSTTVSPFLDSIVTRRSPRGSALVGGLDGQLVAATRRRPCRAGQLELLGHLVGLVGHLGAGEGVRQPVVDHRVDGLGVAHAEAEPGVVEQVGRCDMDSMPPARPRQVPARTARSSTPTARMPEAQTLFTVSEETSLGIPALIWAWRDGIWPWPA